MEYYKDPSNPNKIPILGPQGKALGESWAHAIYFDSSFESYSRAVGIPVNARELAKTDVRRDENCH